MDIFVSVNALPNGDGSFEKPFKDLNAAKEYVKTLTDDNIVVNIMGGRYFFDETLRFTKEDKPCIYRAYDDNSVIFDGGIIINPDDVKRVKDMETLDRIIENSGRENMCEVDLSKYIPGELFPYGEKGFRKAILPSGNELFINKKAYSVSRYPKKEYIKLGKVVDEGSVPHKGDFSCRGGIIGYADSRIEKWKNADNAYIYGFLKNGYADDTIKILKIDADKHKISLANPHMFGIDSTMTETRWKILNLLEEISQQGEYYIDIAEKKLYFYPDCDLENALIQLSVLGTPILSFLNASNIIFDGIIFENSRSSGVYIERGENIVIKNSIFRNLGTVGIQIGMGSNDHGCGKWQETDKGITFYDNKNHMEPVSEQVGNLSNHIYCMAALDGHAGKNHKVSGCEIYGTGAGGIYLGGGNRKKLIPSGNMVYNTHLHNLNRTISTCAPAITLWGVGNIVSHCEIDDLPGNAIIINGNDHLIEYNKIHDVIKEISDGGAIYMGRDQSEVGNKIRYNFIYDIKNPHSYDMYGFTAIYFDDFAIYNEVYGNYFYDIVQKGRYFFATVHWNCGGQTSVANNIFIDCTPGPDPNSYSNSYKVMHEKPLSQMRVHTIDEEDLHGVDVTSDIWREHYPYLYDTYVNNYDHTTVQYNNFVCNGMYHSFVDENPSHLNFKLRDDFYMKSKYADNVVDRVRGIYGERVDFEMLDFDKIGMIRNEVKV